MGLLAWLGLRGRDDRTNLDELVSDLRAALPDDEAVLIRYIAIVAVLLTRVASSDGVFSDQEQSTLRSLLERVGRLSPSAVDAVCCTLERGMTDLTTGELDLCYGELKSLCDRQERLQILRLLVRMAAADGALSAAEATEIRSIGEKIGVAPEDITAIEQDARDASPTPDVVS